MCFFFNFKFLNCLCLSSLIAFWNRNSASIFGLSSASDRKVNLFGTLGGMGRQK